MSNYHKPRTFRSLHGCCICKAKSSSSRFTDSEKYEHDFSGCFKTDDERSGDICNACVLLVKRWKKLPRGSKKNWNHVVDARSGPGGGCKTSSGLRQRSTRQREDPDLKIKKIIKKRPSSTSTYPPPTPEDELMKPQFCTSPSPSDDSTESSTTSAESENVSPFLDLAYWKRTEVCCGVVFISPHNELMIDAKLYKPCPSHRKSSPSASTASVSSRSRTDTISSNNSAGSMLPSDSSSSPQPPTRPSDTTSTTTHHFITPSDSVGASAI